MRQSPKEIPWSFSTGVSNYLAVALLLMAVSHGSAIAEERLGWALSPDRTREVFHNDYNAYAQEPAVFSIVEVGSGELLQQISVPAAEIGRFVSRVEWLDNRFVLALGEALFVAILDTAEGRLAASFRGALMALAKDRLSLAFRLFSAPRYGPRPPLETDFIGVAGLMKVDGEEELQASVVYPQVARLESFRITLAPSEAQRHQVLSRLAWSDNDQSLAFAERHGGKC